MSRFLALKNTFLKSSPISNSRGMTLIEILIVLALVGGLIAIIGSQVFSRFDTAKVRETKIIMSNVSQSIQLYYTDCGSYPPSLEALIEQGQSDCKSWGPNPYLKDFPKDSWNTDLIYENTGSSFVLRSLGKDKKEGGSGVDKDLSSEEL